MALTMERLDQKPSPTTKEKIWRTFFRADPRKVNPTHRDRYFRYYEGELAMLKPGRLPASLSRNQLLAERHEDLISLVGTVRSNDKSKAELCSALTAQYGGDATAASRTADLVLRLWLMVNVREPEASLQAPQTRARQWKDSQSLHDFLFDTFPTSTWKAEAKDGRLHPSFTAAFMVNICGLELEWTDCLADHLTLNREVNTLRVFSHKWVLHAHLKMYNEGATGNDPSPLPRRLLEETIWSLNILFPQWDRDTSFLLRAEQRDFQQIGPYDGPATLNLVEFQYWRDRLSELHDVVFMSPPVSWAQLWRDRRNPQQFWTFWLALVILWLTLISTITGIVQAWASIRALKQ